eukprot:9089651-Lingulodinium_polyedra.AAC.1
MLPRRHVPEEAVVQEGAVRRILCTEEVVCALVVWRLRVDLVGALDEGPPPVERLAPGQVANVELI